MTFEETLGQVRELLEREGRVAYRILRRRFELDNDDLEDLKADLIDAKRLAVDEDGKVLVWTGGGHASTILDSEPRTPNFFKPQSLTPTCQGPRHRAHKRPTTSWTE